MVLQIRWCVLHCRGGLTFTLITPWSADLQQLVNLRREIPETCDPRLMLIFEGGTTTQLQASRTNDSGYDLRKQYLMKSVVGPPSCFDQRECASCDDLTSLVASPWYRCNPRVRVQPGRPVPGRDRVVCRITIHIGQVRYPLPPLRKSVLPITLGTCTLVTYKPAVILTL